MLKLQCCQPVHTKFKMFSRSSATQSSGTVMFSCCISISSFIMPILHLSYFIFIGFGGFYPHTFNVYNLIMYGALLYLYWFIVLKMSTVTFKLNSWIALKYHTKLITKKHIWHNSFERVLIKMLIINWK